MIKEKIKICGITNHKDALCAYNLSAWALGFIFVDSSKRYIKPKEVAEIVQKLPDGIEKIGVFVNSKINEVVESAKIAGLTKIQLHGDESVEYIKELKCKIDRDIIKAIRVSSIDHLLTINDYKDYVFAILLDAYCEKEFGGTGKTFDWDLAIEAKTYGVPIILAGGLNPQNIKQAVEKVNPFALDLSSGVEKEKCVKDHIKLNELFKNI